MRCSLVALFCVACGSSAPDEPPDWTGEPSPAVAPTSDGSCLEPATDGGCVEFVAWTREGLDIQRELCNGVWTEAACARDGAIVGCEMHIGTRWQYGDVATRYCGAVSVCTMMGGTLVPVSGVAPPTCE